MNILEMSLEAVRAEQKRNPYPSKQEYDRETWDSIERFKGRPIFDAYKVGE